jgi:hypothetical protein
LPYVLSFGVLGLRWLSNVELRTRAEYVSSLAAIGLSFVNSRVALWALALNFAGPLIGKWTRRAEVPN